ncbi:MAG: M28 family peptidase [Bacteroidia bacterium]|nr:M28 family peptidase [Bacteroidia bacterium]
MKKTLTLIALMFLTTLAFSQNFVKINVDNLKETQRLFDNPNLKIHYYNDDFVLATTSDGFDSAQNDVTVLDNEAFADNDAYHIVYCDKNNQNSYISNVNKNLQVLYRNENLLIVKSIEGTAMPFKNDGVVAVFDKEAKLPVVTRDYPVITEENPIIREMMNQVNMDSLEATVQFLQDYGERKFNGTHIAQARDWVEAKMLSYGLETEVQEFHVSSWMGSATCHNLIGIQRGTLYPDIYVVCGSHYDSFSYYGLCPGADDNATGTAAVLESARILTQYEFEYSIIYCVFSAEECGLYGSEAYADRCASEGMEILGYFNNDMNGYLNPGDEIHIDCIYPNSVQPIGTYYMNVGSVYFPEMQIQHVNLDYGDSDHTSFNNVGYMGIYPFEDVNHESPYIHTSEDLIGNSVNSFEMSQRYTQMNIGCLTELANPTGEVPAVACNAPQNFELNYPITVKEMSSIELSWQAPEEGSTGELVRYDIYRDMNVIASLEEETGYTDTITVGVTAMYHVVAVYSDDCEASTDTLVGEGIPDGIDENCENNFTIYPNPATEMLTIINNSSIETEVEIVNMIGQIVKKVEIIDRKELNVSDLESGVYFVKMNGVSMKLIIR